MGVDGPHVPPTPFRASSQGSLALGSMQPVNSPYSLKDSVSVGRSNPPPSMSPKQRLSMPGGKALDFRASAPLPPPSPLPPAGPPGALAAYQSAPTSAHHGQQQQQMARLPSVEAPNRPSSAFVGLTSSYRVQVDDKVRNAKPETHQEIRQHTTHVQALAFAKEPETLADNVMLLKRERNALLSDKQLLLVNKRRLEAVLGKLLGLGGMGLTGLDDDDDYPCTPGGRARGGNPMKAKMLKVLDDSKALDNKLSASGGVAAGMTVAEAEAKLNELQDRLSKLTAERDHLVTRLEGELNYRRTQAAAVTSGLQKKLSEKAEENERLHRQVEELQGHLEFQVHELQAKVDSLTKALEEAHQKLNAATDSTIEELKKQLAAAEATGQQQAAKISELEHAVVQRDNQISEITNKETAAAKAAEEAAAKAAAEAAAAEAAAAVLDAVMEEAEAAAVAATVAAAEEDVVAAAIAEAEAAAAAEAAAIAEGVAVTAADAAAAADAEEAAHEEAAFASAREAAGEDAVMVAEAVAGEAAAAAAFGLMADALAAKVGGEEKAELEATKAALAEVEAKLKAEAAKRVEAEAKVAEQAEAAKAIEAKAGETLKAKEAELQKERQEMDKLRTELEAALKASKASAADKEQLAARLREVEGALAAKSARVEELEQKVMGLERDIKDLKALAAKRKGFC